MRSESQPRVLFATTSPTPLRFFRSFNVRLPFVNVLMIQYNEKPSPFCVGVGLAGFEYVLCGLSIEIISLVSGFLVVCFDMNGGDALCLCSVSLLLDLFKLPFSLVELFSAIGKVKGMTLLTLSASVPGMKLTVIHKTIVMLLRDRVHWWDKPCVSSFGANQFDDADETTGSIFEVRRSLHSRLGLPYGRPLLRNSNALDFSKLKSNDMVSLQKVAGGNVSLIFKVPMNTSIIFTKVILIW
ncbi:unnamed protein product [Sphenostylis stenocarpa]|uniref:Uncharacterized protein n=1 Tax=Sphenostylis stenocarpa TaxID=92480 RepID=A0AA86VZ60_9FABA|nr:unnamed protein product [Sphenostylis stenocarpa]